MVTKLKIIKEEQFGDKRIVIYYVFSRVLE